MLFRSIFIAKGRCRRAPSTQAPHLVNSLISNPLICNSQESSNFVLTTHDDENAQRIKVRFALQKTIRQSTRYSESIESKVVVAMKFELQSAWPLLYNYCSWCLSVWLIEITEQTVIDANGLRESTIHNPTFRSIIQVISAIFQSWYF